MSIVIRSVGSALPVRAVTNGDLPAALETSDEWIKTRTGISQRYIAGDDETTSTLAIKAARSALDHAGLTAGDIDGIVLATTTPDLTFPSIATMVQRELGVPAGTMAMDVLIALITTGPVVIAQPVTIVLLPLQGKEILCLCTHARAHVFGA